MLKPFFQNIIVVFIATFIAVIILTGYSILIGEDISFNSFLYGLIIAGGQAFIPLLIFFIVCKGIFLTIQKRNKVYNSLVIQLLVGMVLMGLTIIISVIIDIISSYNIPMSELLNYILNYNMFIIFVPLAILINYFLYTRNNTIE